MGVHLIDWFKDTSLVISIYREFLLEVEKINYLKLRF